MTLQFNTTISFVLETRRKYINGTETPWRVAATGTLDEMLTEKEAHIVAGYDPKGLRIVRVTTIEEVMDV